MGSTRRRLLNIAGADEAPQDLHTGAWGAPASIIWGLCTIWCVCIDIYIYIYLYVEYMVYSVCSV